MKYSASALFGLVSLGLGIALFVSHRDGEAQHERDVEAMTGASNLLSSCQTELTATKEEALTLSNRLEIFQTTSLTLSNHLMEAQSALAECKQDLARQVTGLNQQLERLTMQHEGENQVAKHRMAELAQQVAELTNQLASARANLHQANKDYALLEDRFRRDVAERLIVERKFHNRAELKAQLEALLWNPNSEISEDRIREGLNVVVGQSNRWYVIAPE